MTASYYTTSSSARLKHMLFHDLKINTLRFGLGACSVLLAVIMVKGTAVLWQSPCVVPALFVWCFMAVLQHQLYKLAENVKDCGNCRCVLKQLSLLRFCLRLRSFTSFVIFPLACVFAAMAQPGYRPASIWWWGAFILFFLLFAVFSKDQPALRKARLASMKLEQLNQ